MRLDEVMAELEQRGSAQQRKTYARHGAVGEFYGVKIGDLELVAKKLEGDQELALELFRTGNGDAMYLAGLVADGRKMTQKQLDAWVRAATWPMIAEYTVPWVATESAHGREAALAWIESAKEHVVAAGWNTYSCVVAVKPDEELELDEIERLLARVEKQIARAPGRVRYCMNGFVIAVGCAVKPLLAKAKAAAKRIGKVEVDMGDTACKVPPALETIAKVESMGRVGVKRKKIKC